MVHKILILLLLLALLPIVNGCKKKGCTDALALNFDIDKKVDDGSCRFSSGILFRSKDTWNAELITRIEVSGSYQGEPKDFYDNDEFSLTYNSAFNLNCNSPGTVLIEFLDSREFLWNASIYTENSQMPYVVEGGFTPDPNRDCIFINVTP